MYSKGLLMSIIFDAKKVTVWPSHTSSPQRDGFLWCCYVRSCTGTSSESRAPSA